MCMTLTRMARSLSSRGSLSAQTSITQAQSPATSGASATFPRLMGRLRGMQSATHRVMGGARLTGRGTRTTWLSMSVRLRDLGPTTSLSLSSPGLLLALWSSRLRTSSLSRMLSPSTLLRRRLLWLLVASCAGIRMLSSPQTCASQGMRSTRSTTLPSGFSGHTLRRCFVLLPLLAGRLLLLVHLSLSRASRPRRSMATALPMLCSRWVCSRHTRCPGGSLCTT
mmetsp:Transcript_19235/g.37450  ORF Transcript_19235/g.37450 Transcript_19235/m.37450 type:complete len:224 (+) Transcript_19235:1226-1897(+)